MQKSMIIVSARGMAQLLISTMGAESLGVFNCIDKVTHRMLISRMQLLFFSLYFAITLLHTLSCSNLVYC